MTRLTPEDRALGESIRTRREELARLIGRIDIADSGEDGERHKREALFHLHESIRSALRALNAPPADQRRPR